MENKNDVSGGIVIEQLKRYCKRISDDTGQSANCTIEVWHHPENTIEDNFYSVGFKAFDYAHRQRLTPFPHSDDLRSLGNLIDSVIRQRQKDKPK